MKNLSRIVLGVIGLSLLATGAVRADESAEPRENHFALGWDLGTLGTNYGVGLRVDSPRFCEGRMHLQFAADYAWVSGVEVGTTDTTWDPYGMFRLGIFGGRMIGELPLRLYGGGGPVMIWASSRLSSRSTEWGIHAVTGVEIFLNPDHARAWYVELGGLGTTAKADRMFSTPIYANGFTAAFGFRYFL